MSRGDEIALSADLARDEGESDPSQDHEPQGRSPQRGISLKLDTLLTFVAQLFTALATFAASVVIARRVGPTVLGHYSYVIWLIGVISSLLVLGVPTALAKYSAELTMKGDVALARRLGRRLTSGTLALTAIVAGLLIALHLIRLISFGAPYSGLEIPLAFASLVPLVFVSCANGVLTGYRDFRSIATISAVAQPAGLILLVAVLVFRPSITLLLAYFISTTVITAICYSPRYVHRTRQRTGPVTMPVTMRREVQRYVLTASVLIFLDQILWDRSEVLFLNHYASAQQIAFYSTSYLLTSGAMALIPGSIGAVLLPTLSGLEAAGDHTAVADLYRTATRYVGLLVFCMVGVGIGVATALVSVLYGPQFHGMVPVFCILLFTGGVAVVASVGATVMYTFGWQGRFLWLAGCLCVVNIALDFALIPRTGALGAGIANGVAQGGLLLPATVMLWRRGYRFPLKSYLPILVSTFCAAAVALASRSQVGGNDISGLVVGSASGTATYIVVALGLGAISIAEIRAILGTRGRLVKRESTAD